MSPRVVYTPNAKRPGRQYGWGVIGDKARIELQPQEAGVLLAVMFIRSARREELIDALWGDDENGGPLCANNTLNVHVYKLNKKLRPFGWRIRKYRLEQAT